MATHYVSYDIREGNDYAGIYKFRDDYGGVEITESLYKFDTTVGWAAFLKALRDAVEGDDSVYVITLTTSKTLGLFKVTDG